jgi:sortase A
MIIRMHYSFAAGIGTALKCASRASFCAGLGLFGWFCYINFESAYTQWSGARVLAAESVGKKESIVPAPPTAGKNRSAVPLGAVLGKLELPRIGISYVVLEGTDDKTLDKSIGRVVTSAPLGDKGNIAIAGHRNTHFRKLEWVRRDDEIVVTVRGAQYRYKVEWARLFDPSDVEVLDPEHGPAVTLITCFPFEYVGSAPLRFVVRALPDEETRAKLTAISASLQK